jgi:hypothetical protein
LISCLQISDTNIHLAKEIHEISQQRDLQVAPAAAGTCPTLPFTVHFTTSSLGNSGSKGKFYIAGYGKFPLECQEKGAKCDITICGRNTLDIIYDYRKDTHKDAWTFSISGDIGPLVSHREHQISGKQNTIGGGFPTKMGGGWDLLQSYQLVILVDGYPTIRAGREALDLNILDLDIEEFFISVFVAVAVAAGCCCYCCCKSIDSLMMNSHEDEDEDADMPVAVAVAIAVTNLTA